MWKSKILLIWLIVSLISDKLTNPNTFLKFGELYGPGADAIKKLPPSLRIPYLGV